MADLLPRERLQPSLLDRLTDDSPGERDESRDRRVMSASQLKAAVLRDLEWLFNTIAHPEEYGLEALPEVAGSVANFGIRNLCGVAASGLEEGDVESIVKKTIERFEPRIFLDSLELNVTIRKNEYGPNAVVFELKGQIWAQPMPEPLFFRTEVDLATGETKRVG